MERIGMKKERKSIKTTEMVYILRNKLSTAQKEISFSAMRKCGFIKVKHGRYILTSKGKSV